MNENRKRVYAANAIKRNIYNWFRLSKKQQADAQLLLIALYEIVNIRYCTDEWDLLCFSTSPELREKFIEALQIERDPARQVETLIGLIETMEDPSFFHANRSAKDYCQYQYYC